jgi:3-hydroxyisobutyrate dehydrogenase-like beta-hydroxyacid dehydrogenase
VVAVAVLGQGAVGRAAADRLAAAGHEVHAGDRADRARVLAAPADVLLLALTRGEECAAQLAEARRLPPAVLDLTTQPPESALRCADRAAATGAGYHGGGLTGGGRELRAGRAVLLLGPPVRPGTPAAAVVGALGRAIPFAGPEAAARAKVLHNWVLLAQQWAAALALADAREHGIDSLVEVLAAGTAGRPVPEWSVVRDAAGEPTSTYPARLAAKDLAVLTRTAPRLAGAAAPLLAELGRAFARLPDRPYTEALLHAAAAPGPAEEAS